MALVPVNKHVMTDGTYDYYRDKRGEWKPGYYDGRIFWWIRTRKFSARHRTYKAPERGAFTVRVTRYTTGRSSKPAYAPIGKTGRQYKRARLETIRDVFYRHGMFYEACNIQRENGTYYNWVKPIDGVIYDAHENQSTKAGIPIVKIFCNDGIPTAIEMDNETYDVNGDWRSLYLPVLQIQDVDPKKDKTDETATVEERKNDGGELYDMSFDPFADTDYVDTNSDEITNTDIIVEAEKIIQSLIDRTTEGEQISLDLWAECIA